MLQDLFDGGEAVAIGAMHMQVGAAELAEVKRLLRGHLLTFLQHRRSLALRSCNCMLASFCGHAIPSPVLLPVTASLWLLQRPRPGRRRPTGRGARRLTAPCIRRSSPAMAQSRCATPAPEPTKREQS